MVAKQSFFLNYPEFLHVIELDLCDSTNDYLKMHQFDLKDTFPVLVNSLQQDKGRGRDDRNWLSLKHKGLYSSFGFVLEDKSFLNLLPLISGISVIKTLKKVIPHRFSLKWPNDILADHKKISGILIENKILKDSIFCIVGIGININHTQEDFPGSLSQKSTSLRSITGAFQEVDEIKKILSHIFFLWLDKAKEGKHKEIIELSNYMSAYSKGDKISFHHRKDVITGYFEGINSDGGLILQNHQGNRICYSGEIEL